MSGLRIGRPSAEKSPCRHAGIGTVGLRSAEVALPFTVSPDANQNVRLRPLNDSGDDHRAAGSKAGEMQDARLAGAGKRVARAQTRALVVVEHASRADCSVPDLDTIVTWPRLGNPRCCSRGRF